MHYLARWTRRLKQPKIIQMCGMAAVLWCLIAILLNRVVPPYMSPDNGRTFVLDLLALTEATSIITFVATLSWVAIIRFVRRLPIRMQGLIAIAMTWLLLGVPFALIDKCDLFDASSITRFRATRVMGNGNDIAFLPLVIPVCALLSGITFSVAMWFARWSEKKSATRMHG
jgi:hypothetical protein